MRYLMLFVLNLLLRAKVSNYIYAGLANIGKWPATALTFGVLVGYLFYTAVHHATHHWRVNGDWFKQRKRWHALHHYSHNYLTQQ